MAIHSRIQGHQNGAVEYSHPQHGIKMNRNETAAPSVNLFPLLALSALTLLGVVAGLFMLTGLHNKIPKQAGNTASEASVSVDEIGQIVLDQNTVRINLMKRNGSGKLDKAQEIEIPLEKFASGYPRLKSFMDQMIEKGIITPPQ